MIGSARSCNSYALGPMNLTLIESLSLNSCSEWVVILQSIMRNSPEQYRIAAFLGCCLGRPDTTSQWGLPRRSHGKVPHGTRSWHWKSSASSGRTELGLPHRLGGQVLPFARSPGGSKADLYRPLASHRSLLVTLQLYFSFA